VNRLPLLEQAVHGSNRQLTLLAAQGLLPLPAAELVGAQVELAEHLDPEISALARSSLQKLGAQVLLPLIGEVGEGVLRFFGTHSTDQQVVEAILRRRDVPSTVLIELAPRLGADLQEVLLLRQDRIVSEPAILAELERNPDLSAFARRRIQEYREHLLASARPDEESAPGTEETDPSGVAAEPSEEEVVAAISRARELAASEGEVDEVTGLSESQIRLLPIPVRLKLARGAPLTLRGLLIRDSNPRVALAVIESNPLADQEVEAIAKSRTVVVEVLEAIARQRRWLSKYAIAISLVSNPRTPLSISTKLVPRLSVRDLRNLGRDRNVPDAVRSMAQRLYRIKLQ
jgi:hypothetical protein